MRLRPIPTLILTLAAIAVALGAYILLVERHGASTDEARTNRAKLLPNLSRSQLTRLRIQQENTTPLLLERAIESGADAPWRVMPAAAPADSAAVDELLTEIDFAEVDRAAEVSPQSAGLTPPAVVIELATRSHSDHLRLGRADPSGRGVYVQRGDDGSVLVVSHRLLELASHGTTSLRERRLIPAVVVAQATALRWTAGGDGGVETERIDLKDGRWMNQRLEWVARDRVTEALRRMGDLKADRFVTASANASALTRTLDVDLATGNRWALRFRAGGCPEASHLAIERRAAASAEWLCVPKASLETAWALLSGAHRRAPKLVASLPGDVTAVDIIAGDRRLTLRHEGGAWRIMVPAVTYQIDPDAVSAWLSELAAVTIVDGATKDGAFEGPAHRLTLTSLFTEQVEIGTPQGPNVRAHRKGEAGPVMVPSRVLALVDPDPLRFRSRAVLSFARYDARRVRVTTARGSEEAVKDPDETWHLAQPEGATLDSAALDQTLAIVTNLRALRFISDSGAFPVERTLEVVEVPPGAAAGLADRTHRLDLAAPAAEGCRARISTVARTRFVLAPQVCAELKQPLAAKNARQP